MWNDFPYDLDGIVNDDEPTIYEEEELTKEEEHNALQELVELDLDDRESYIKYCTDPDNPEEHMGETVNMDQTEANQNYYLHIDSIQ